MLDNFKAHLKDIAELSNLKNIVRFSILKRQINNYDLDLFYQVVEKMKLESEKWNGNFNYEKCIFKCFPVNSKTHKCQILT